MTTEPLPAKKLIIGHTLAEAVRYAEDHGIARKDCWRIGENVWEVYGGQGKFVAGEDVIWLDDPETFNPEFRAAVEVCIQP